MVFGFRPEWYKKGAKDCSKAKKLVTHDPCGNLIGATSAFGTAFVKILGVAAVEPAIMCVSTDLGLHPQRCATDNKRFLHLFKFGLVVL